MIVREAEKHEMDRVLDLCCKGAQELSDMFENQTPEKRVIKDFLNIRSKFPCLVVERNNEIIGVAPLMGGFYWWNGNPYLTSLIVYITPDGRKTGAVKLLYDRIKQICIDYDINYIDHYMSSKSNNYISRLTDKVDLNNIGIIVRY